MRSLSIVSKLERFHVPILLAIGIAATFIREVFIAYYYGSSKEVEIYKVAFSVPYALFQSLGSVLVAGILPLVIQSPASFSFIKRNIRLIYGTLTLVAVFTTDIQASILAPGFDTEALILLSENLRITWTILFLSGMIFPLRLQLQYHDKKTLVAATSLVFSLAFIVMLITAHGWLPFYNLSIFSVVSIAIVYTFYLFDSKTLPATNTDEEYRDKPVSRLKIANIVAGSLVYIVLLSLPRIIDRSIASHMPSGTIANLEYAMNFYVAMGVLIGTSFTIIYAKEIAQHYRTRITDIKWLFKIFGIPVLIATFVSFLFFLFAQDIVTLTYVRGSFSTSDAQQVYHILVWFLVALPAMIGGMMMTQLLAAYHTLLLVLFVFLKVAGKYLYIALFFHENSVAIFGESTLFMEVTSIILICLLLLLWNNRKW